jgi:hypothetical protein
MTKEQILAAIAQAVETGSVGNCDTGFITKVKEQNSGGSVTFWVGTQAQYNALEEKASNCMYIITDDTTTADMKAAFAAAVADAEEAARQASAAVAAVMPIDITDKLTFTLGYYNPAGVNNLNITATETMFLYSPATKTVFFNLRFSVQGAVSAGDIFSVKFDGSYLPSNHPKRLQYTSYNALCNSEKCRATITTAGVMFKALEDMENAAECNQVTGWYFCEGEGI